MDDHKLRDTDFSRNSPSREDRPATKDELLKDAKSVVEQLTSAWDLEVEALVILVPKGSEEYGIASTIVGNDRARRILKDVARRFSTMGNLVKKV